MKKYEIEINNEVYRVSVKELEADADMSTDEDTPSPTPTSTEGTEVNAPMAGTVLNVNVTAGDPVSQGDTLVILEAMKMENEVVAPADGVVGEIFVNANDRVKSDHILLTI